jgi:hypothetical protein
MEDRHLIAYSLCAAILAIGAAFVVHYLNKRRRFKIRQSGRGKTTNSVPAE